MIDLNHFARACSRKGEITIENAYQYSLNPKGLEKNVLIKYMLFKYQSIDDKGIKKEGK